jgi:hypothetical protein
LSFFESRPNCGAGAARENVEKTDADKTNSKVTNSDAAIIVFFIEYPIAAVPTARQPLPV